MLAIREEELNMVNGGVDLMQIARATGLYRPKFAIGDRVMCKELPEIGVGEVIDINFHDGYTYTVKMGQGRLYAAEKELEFAIM